NLTMIEISNREQGEEKSLPFGEDAERTCNDLLLFPSVSAPLREISFDRRHREPNSPFAEALEP
ncbi:MAG TPA: hypothetical protein VE890_13040, partial [Thermoguttaceae bacterium]|nr:hypothetical protein [Thermoguttaceae bacterium]